MHSPAPYDSGISALSWICLSDTHFGAENSLLSLVKRDDASIDPDNPSPVLSALIACLRDLVDLDPNAPRPTLILNGDILELALAEDNVAAMVFDRFVDLAFDPNYPLFNPTILYLPGNHDHHLWETARERMYADYVATTPVGDELVAPYHATRLFVNRGGHDLEAELVNALVRRRWPREHLHVKVVYPNLGLESTYSGRQVLIHHGHFTESIYRLMSFAKATLFPKQPLGDEVWDWEADNFAWIDFFWSTLGRSGSAGQDVGLIYDMLQNKGAMRRLAGELGEFAGDRGPRPTRVITKWLGREAAGDLVDVVSGRERQHPEVVLTAAGRQGLMEYLGGPLARQYIREGNGQTGEKVSFVFGHTHKPFECTLEVPGFSGPLSIYNSGGWVVDTPDTQANQGAAVLLIDADCNVTSLRMYNQASSPAGYMVSLSSVADTTTNDLRERLAAGLQFDQSPWRDFSETVAAEVTLRHELLPKIIQRGLKYTD